VVTQTKLKAELRHDYRAHLPTKDGDELIRSYMPPAACVIDTSSTNLRLQYLKASKRLGRSFTFRTLNSKINRLREKSVAQWLFCVR
jgi:hypothetical protein